MCVYTDKYLCCRDYINVLRGYATYTGKKVQRTPGDRWMVVGPAEYIPRAEIGKTEKRYTCTAVVLKIDYIYVLSNIV